jgi:hypothetical protein
MISVENLNQSSRRSEAFKITTDSRSADSWLLSSNVDARSVISSQDDTFWLSYDTKSISLEPPLQ